MSAIPTRIVVSGAVVAIDPGASGGIAWSRDGAVSCKPMPDTEGDVVAAIESLMPISRCVVEEVGGYINGVGTGPAMFNFGRNFGFLLGVLMAKGVRVELVRPQKWQKEFSLGKKKDCAKPSEWKNKLKSRSQQLYPSIKITLKTADALLILNYATKQQT